MDVVVDVVVDVVGVELLLQGLAGAQNFVTRPLTHHRHVGGTLSAHRDQ